MAANLRADLAVLVVPTMRLEESVRFYRDAIGLRLIEEWSDMGRGALFEASTTTQVELVEMESVLDVDEPRTTLGLKITGVDEVYERIVAFGGKVKAAPRTREWGMYGFGAFDPNGMPINIYEPTQPESSSPGGPMLVRRSESASADSDREDP
jgi:predicted enzyme related to lactoylglutathione lyase